MFEIMLAGAVVVAMVKIADADGQSAALWGVIALAITIACVMLIPLPLIRVVIALVVSFILMMIFKKGVGGG